MKVNHHVDAPPTAKSHVNHHVNPSKPPCRCTANRKVDVQAQDCCKGAAKLSASLAARLLQDCGRSAARVPDSRLAASLLQDCPPARPRFKKIALLQDFCKSAARVLHSRLATSLLQDCPPVRPRHCFKMVAARLLQECRKACFKAFFKACCKIAAKLAARISKIGPGCCKAC